MRRCIKPIILLSLVLLVIAGLHMDQPMMADQPSSFTFAVFGDNRPSLPTQTMPETFKRVLKAIDVVNPAFAVNTGDCIFGSYGSRKLLETQYKDYADTTKSLLRTKVYLAIGNHEILGSKANQEFFTKELGGSPYYSFDYEDSHFIALDSEVVGQAGKIAGEQLEWLKDDLQKSRAARHKFVFLHRPLYPVDGHMGSSMDVSPKDRDALHSLFARNRITAVFVGHEHLYNYQVRNGVWYIITGGGGAFTYPSSRGEGDFYHFVEVKVNGDKVEMQVRKLAQGGKPAEVIPIGETVR